MNKNQRIKDLEATVLAQHDELDVLKENIAQGLTARARLSKLAAILSDLDRCEHGRHEDEGCFGCPAGFSVGNPGMRSGQVVGYSIGGRPIRMPVPGIRSEPDAWGPKR